MSNTSNIIIIPEKDITNVVTNIVLDVIYDPKPADIMQISETTPGPQGLKGDKGDVGATGLKGDKGDTGAQGLQGLKGDKGDKGDTGIQGSQGLQGIQGIQGIQGLRGFTGPQGVQGKGLAINASVQTESELPTIDNVLGWVIHVQENNHVYTWDGMTWFDMGPWNYSEFWIEN